MFAAVSARAVVSTAYGRAGLDPGAPLSVLAVGKAASAMTRAFAELRGVPPRAGLVIGTHGGAPAPYEWRESAHPVPDSRSEQAAKAALALARGIAPGERLLVLVSGGASALMALAVPAVSLADKQATTRRLLDAGADIHALNCVRKHISAVKGGRLGQACPGVVDAWLLSDVVGDDPSVIGSGPTVPDTSTFAEALAVIDAHGGRDIFPTAVVDHLARGQAGAVAETPKSPADLPRVTTRVVGSAVEALDGAERAARTLGYDVVRRPTPVVGEARTAAAAHLAWMREIAAAPSRALCLLASGETTVKVIGSGRGGRNQEFALALVADLNGASWLVASVGTDGIDGPTPSAGAWVDGSTAQRATAAGLDPMAYLHANDAWSFFTRVGGLITTGPSDTNVGDVQIALIRPSADRGVE